MTLKLSSSTPASDSGRGFDSPVESWVFSPISYPGAKNNLASWIDDHLPEQYSLYCEPFCGSAAVYFEKQQADREVLNDVNDDILRFFEGVRDHPDELREWLKKTPYSRKQFRELKEEWFIDGERPDDPVRRAGEYYILMEQGYTGNLEPSSFSRETPKPNTGLVDTWRNKVDERIDAAAERLRDACIESMDYRECIETYDYPETVFYCDPPYFNRSTDYNAGDFSHEEFADAVRGVDADVVVSYDELPPAFLELVNGEGWFVVEKGVVRTVINYEQTDEVKERLVMNYDPSEAVAGQQKLDDAAAD